MNPMVVEDMRDIVKGGEPMDLASVPAAAVLLARDRLRASKWRFLEAHDRAQPRAMLLRPLRANGEVVDFEWEQLSRGAAQMFGGDAAELVGRCLRDSPLAREPGFRAAFESYRQAARNGLLAVVEIAHTTADGPHTVRHAVTRLGAAVFVTLTDLTAQRRAEALWAEVLAEERKLQAPEPVPAPRRRARPDRARPLARSTPRCGTADALLRHAEAAP